jgi:hypothetical protein
MNISVKDAALIADTINRVSHKIDGRLSQHRGNVFLMGMTVLMAGCGNHLEIGTLFGGSAIVVVLLKKEMEMTGDVYCIDPLDGYYRDSEYCKSIHLSGVCDPVTGLEISPAVVEMNAREFRVFDRIKLITQKSHPWPIELNGGKFTTAYIDGDHWDGMPLKDWKNVKDRVSRYVVFDNCDESRPDVLKAHRAACDDPEWEEVYRGDIARIVGRVK